ncbi:cold-shock DNA-binding protein family protein [Ectopseudomonas mendocina]|uniref:Cold-shock DNA-binding protein family protein n=1 Tax=Ectopseudomonas mendocina TaxID=300 RepID=A0A379IYH1_ECTME|nr:cold-shock protein [Pseudomonas mendocina]SUD31979.1 cold-shock DNA-binding protein family protein [Pseudomonas mendocina]SUD41265.1 cold-shock DNA-binding protein family protein [Pseudomonas mendocina]
MFKIAHLVTGFAALLLSAVPGISTSFLTTPDAVYLALTGLINLLVAAQQPSLPAARQQLLGLSSALLILAAVVQALILLAPLPNIGGQPAIWLPLLTVVVAVALSLVAQLNVQPRAREQQPFAQPSSSAPQEDRETGTVKWFNTSKGFGFISRDSGEDIFVHFRAIRGEGHRVLIEGQRVEFSVMQRDKGLQAEDVIAAAPSRR